jgi:hypothetical protein
MLLRGLIGGSIYSAPQYLPTRIFVLVFTNRSPQIVFPQIAALVGLQTPLDKRLRKSSSFLFFGLDSQSVRLTSTLFY